MEKNLLEISWPSLVPFITLKEYVSVSAIVPNAKTALTKEFATISYTSGKGIATLLLWKRAVKNQNMLDVIATGIYNKI